MILTRRHALLSPAALLLPRPAGAQVLGAAKVAGLQIAPSFPRPSYNTGVGFFTLPNAPTIYDANGYSFRPRGINRLRGSGSQADAGIANSKANIERFAMGFDPLPPDIVTSINTIIGAGIIPIIANFINSAGTVTSGDTNPATITQSVTDWINSASTWKPFEKYMIINIANEWGPQAPYPSPNTIWRDTYITAVQNLRGAGFNGLLLIDAPASGQDRAASGAPFIPTVIPHGPAIIAADPQKNVAFGCHCYGNIQAGQALSYLTPLAQSGLPAIISEFGPGRNIGPSPSTLTPGEMISACEQLGLGWIGWAFDDNNQPNASSNDNSFAMSWANYIGTPTQAWWPAGATGGAYAASVATDLTTWGSNIILGTSPWGASPAGNVPGMCLSALAKKCSVFLGGGPGVE